MEPEVGSILEGKVTSIMKFGAFVSLGNGRSGLVHISEIANTFVNDVHDFLQEGQEVRVKVIAIDPTGKISLSVKRAQEPSPAAKSQPKAPLTFEEKLKQFMSDSDSKISGCRQYEHKTKSRRR